VHFEDICQSKIIGTCNRPFLSLACWNFCEYRWNFRWVCLWLSGRLPDSSDFLWSRIWF